MYSLVEKEPIFYQLDKLAKLAFALMKHEQLYRPRTLNNITGLRDYYIDVYGKILEKLNKFSSEKILPKDNYLEKIKHNLEKEYSIDLSNFSDSI